MTVIVVGIDGSESSQRALEWAAEEARLRGALLTVVHAWMDVFVAGSYYAAPSVYESTAVGEAARETLDKAVASIPDGAPALSVEPVLVHGPPEVALVRQSKRADMVVVGSRGRGGFAGLVLGSVSQRVVHDAECPVVVVR
jgi:nucleotide-binding universal stress UspA family protein